jgi:hypothetical protein
VVHVFGIPYSVSHVYASQLGRNELWDIIQGNMQRRWLIMLLHPVLARLAWEVLTTPPADEEIHLLTEVVEEVQEQNLEPAEIETHLRGTRIWHWLMVISTVAESRVAISDPLVAAPRRMTPAACPRLWPP